MKIVTFFVTAWACVLSFNALGESLLHEGDTIVLVGDSITEQSYRNKSTGFYHQLTNAAALTVPEKKLTFIPLGYSGYQIGSWSAMERGSLTRDRWTNYRDPGWNLREVFAEKVDVIAIFLGMNDILQPSIRDTEDDIAKWQADTRKFIHDLRDRCHPRQFVFCTITPLTADSESPKNVVREKLNARLRELAVEEGAVVADYGAAVMELIEQARRIAPDLQPVPDFVHPKAIGHTAMALELAQTLGEKSMVDYLNTKYAKEVAALADSVKKPALSHRLRMLRTVKADDDEIVYELKWNWRDDGKGRTVTRMPQVSVQMPAGWSVAPQDVCGLDGTFFLRGRPDRIETVVTLVAACGEEKVEQTIRIPTPWRVSAPFDFAEIWQGQNWKTNAPVPVAAADVKEWKLATASMDYTGFMNPGSLDPYQTFFGFRNDSFYAVRWVHSEKARRVAAQFSHQTFSATLGLVLTVNSTDVLACDMNRSVKNKVDAEIDLKAGWNEIRIRCDHANWQRQFAFSLVPLAGDDLSGLRYSWKVR